LPAPTSGECRRDYMVRAPVHLGRRTPVRFRPSKDVAQKNVASQFVARRTGER